ncbi:MAG TPA: S8 family serine peptidase [Casimicrobiaceae bacterium]|nr:S8 family serine peptidase [Casimicrobiaceae bacterium]
MSTPGDTKAASRAAVAKALALSEEVLSRLDGELRRVLEAIVSQDWKVLLARTGIASGKDASPQSLPLFIELERNALGERSLQNALQSLELEIAPTWYRELERASSDAMPAVVPAMLPLAQGDPRHTRSGAVVTEQLERIVGSPFVQRIRLASPHPRCSTDSSVDALDWGTPPSSNRTKLRGRDIVIGIVDEGCAFAHPDFLRSAGAWFGTRVLCLWDQSRAPTAAEQALGWDGSQINYGREIDAASMNLAIAAHTQSDCVDEAAVYAQLGYEISPAAEIASHGTMVMGIAAGNGRGAMGRIGVAPEADVIFVHLPPDEVSVHGSALGNRIADAAAYVFARAEALGKKAAVVNVSYGGYRGAHDGTNGAELAFDFLLSAAKNRAIVVSAGNGFASDCHIAADLATGAFRDFHWHVAAEDPTPNDIELWYSGAASLRIALVSPDGATFGPFGFESQKLLRASDGKTIGEFEQTQADPRNEDNVALISLRPTDPGAETANEAPSPAGMWILRVQNGAAAAASLHGWIERDDLSKRRIQRQQSHFAREQTHPGCTIGDLASGRLTIAAGAFNARTGEVCSYSACGPTRASKNNASRPKPEVCAPAEEDGAGRGVLATASARAQPRRFNGTSASAPHVTGVVALAFDLVRNHRRRDLDAVTLRAALAGQTTSPLRSNRYIEADATHPVKQSDVMKDLIGVGKLSLNATLANI